MCYVLLRYAREREIKVTTFYYAMRGNGLKEKLFSANIFESIDAVALIAIHPLPWSKVSIWRNEIIPENFEVHSPRGCGENSISFLADVKIGRFSEVLLKQDKFAIEVVQFLLNTLNDFNNFRCLKIMEAFLWLWSAPIGHTIANIGWRWMWLSQVVYCSTYSAPSFWALRQHGLQKYWTLFRDANRTSRWVVQWGDYWWNSIRPDFKDTWKNELFQK